MNSENDYFDSIRNMFADINLLFEKYDFDDKKIDDQHIDKNKISYLSQITYTIFENLIDKKINSEDKEIIKEKIKELFINIEKGSTCLELREEEFQKIKECIRNQSELFSYVDDDNGNGNNQNGYKYSFFIIRRINNKYFLFTHKLFHEELLFRNVILNRLKNNEKDLDFNNLDENILKKNGESSNHDKSSLIDIIKKILSFKTFFLTGGPGTGKTYLSSFIYIVYKKLYKDSKILLCAPTGKASKVLKDKIRSNIENILGKDSFDISSLEVKTVHRLLEYNPRNNDFNYNSKNKLECDLLIVDEASMIDIYMFRKLLEALSNDTKLIIVGDKDQLPSIEAGNIFSEIIRSNIECKYELDKTHRSNEEILKVLNEIKKIDDKDTKYKNRFEDIIKKININEIKTLINHEGKEEKIGVYFANCELNYGNIIYFIRSYINDFYLENPRSSIILTPFNENSLISVDRINDLIDKISKEVIEEKSKKREYKKQDFEKPIIITKNDYENELFNGDILYYKPYSGDFRATIENRSISLNLINNYKDGYSITIHKSQGSEYNNVFIFVPDVESELVTNELLYTAISRAKDKVFIIGSYDVFLKSLSIREKRVSSIKEDLEIIIRNQT